MESLQEHLKKRYCTTSLYPQSIVFDEDERIITFLLWNLSGQLAGYQQYRPDNHEKNIRNNPEKRYYTFTGTESDHGKAEKRIAFFGFETFYYSPMLILVEGIFNAVRLHSSGFSALAILSNDPKPYRHLFKATSRPILTICDGDAGGKKLAKYGHYSIQLADGMDVGDLCEKEYNKLTDEIWKLNLKLI